MSKRKRHLRADYPPCDPGRKRIPYQIQNGHPESRSRHHEQSSQPPRKGKCLDKQNHNIDAGSRVHSLLFIIRALLSIFLYSIPTMLVSIFSRNTGHCIARAWSRRLLRAGCAEINVAGLESLDTSRRYVFIANHQSHLDIPALMSTLPFNLVFIAKKELFRFPFFGWGISMLGHISIDRSSARKARESFTNAVSRLKKEDIALVIFPEGTRSPDGIVGTFKRGSFALPLEAGLPIVPVTIRGTRNILPKKSYLIHPGKATITVHEPVTVNGASAVDKENAATRVREIIVRNTETEQIEKDRLLSKKFK
ncbi:MAG: 1-acylglycerol-3-phosphate O-acyltransferase [Chitinivibrionales bacterium]|nr:1-acylglycerol-3-phosphate O-acyltransferase [Chitinivibrionales bacterium]